VGAFLFGGSGGIIDLRTSGFSIPEAGRLFTVSGLPLLSHEKTHR
jgi:hypothetical protein